jgi:hypothetical protein
MASVQTYVGDDSQGAAAPTSFRPRTVEEWLLEGRERQAPSTETQDIQFPGLDATAVDTIAPNRHEWLFSACERRIVELVLRIDVQLAGRTPRLTQFISVDRGAGGSTVAIAYASASAALRQRRVLFLSADEGQSGLGVLECVAQGMPLDEAVTRLHGTLFCGTLTGANNSGMAARALMSDASLMQSVRAGYDEVVLDCRCIDVSQAALTVAPHVDGVVLVIQAGRTRHTDVQQLVNALDALEAKVLGVVLNRSASARRNASGNADE